ncbi:hypothetical protein D1007_25286 [Hordeum vulgare]|nr:hypothetical protein D1007_25286 [Hordeum vulgare]
MLSKRMNIALLTKWLWTIANGDGGLWLDIIRNKYLRGQPLAFCELLHFLRIGSSILIGSGTSVEVSLLDLGNLAFCRRFGPSEISTWDEMLECIALHSPDIDIAANRISWRLEPLDRISSRSLYRAIAPSTAPEALTAMWAIRDRRAATSPRALSRRANTTSSNTAACQHASPDAPASELRHVLKNKPPTALLQWRTREGPGTAGTMRTFPDDGDDGREGGWGWGGG